MHLIYKILLLRSTVFLIPSFAAQQTLSEEYNDDAPLRLVA